MLVRMIRLITPMFLGRALTHDEEKYKDPMKFRPERFDGRFLDIKALRICSG